MFVTAGLAVRECDRRGNGNIGKVAEICAVLLLGIFAIHIQCAVIPYNVLNVSAVFLNSRHKSDGTDVYRRAYRPTAPRLVVEQGQRAARTDSQLSVVTGYRYRSAGRDVYAPDVFGAVQRGVIQVDRTGAVDHQRFYRAVGKRVACYFGDVFTQFYDGGLALCVYQSAADHYQIALLFHPARIPERAGAYGYAFQQRFSGFQIRPFDALCNGNRIDTV